MFFNLLLPSLLFYGMNTQRNKRSRQYPNVVFSFNIGLGFCEYDVKLNSTQLVL